MPAPDRETEAADRTEVDPNKIGRWEDLVTLFKRSTTQMRGILVLGAVGKFNDYMKDRPDFETILRRKLDGKSEGEIAEEIGCTIAKVVRRFRMIERRLFDKQ